VFRTGLNICITSGRMMCEGANLPPAMAPFVPALRERPRPDIRTALQKEIDELQAAFGPR